MKFKNLRVWIYIFGLISLVAVYLYQQSKTNRNQLESQSIKAIALAKSNLLEAYYNYHVQLEGYLTRNFFDILGGELSASAAEMVQILDQEKRFEILAIRLLNDEERRASRLDTQQIDVFHRDSAALLKVDHYPFDFSRWQSKIGVGAFYRLEAEISNRLNAAFSVSQGAMNRSDIYFEISHLIPLPQLMKHNLQAKFFDHLLVLDGEGVVLYPGQHKGLNLTDPFPFQRHLEGENESGFPIGHAGEHLFQLNLGNVTYEVFLSSFFLGNKMFHLAGLKESQQFQRAAYRIDFNLLVFMLAALTLVFISIPVISVFNLSEGDVLTRGRVVGLGFSLIALALVMGYSLAFRQNQNAIDADIEIIEGIGKSFVDQSTSLLNSLESLHLTGYKDQEYFPLQSPKIREYINFSSVGDIKKLIFPDEGNILDLDSGSFINISGRDYVNEAVRNQGEAFISAHLSNATGKPEGVVSRFTNGEGWAITFEVDGNSTFNSSGHRYFIFRPDGKVLIKSKGLQMPVNHLQHVIEENKLTELQQLISNNDTDDRGKSWEMPLYVNGHEYLALISKLPLEGFSSSVWMMYLLDQSLQDSLFILTSFETLAVLFPYFLILVGIVLLIILAKPQSVYLNIKPFAFDWYRPTSSKRDQFLFANYVLFLLILLFLLVYLYIPLNIFSISLWSAVFAITGSICNFILIHPRRPGLFGSRDFNFLAPTFFLWLLVASALAYFSLKSLPSHYGWSCFSLIVVLFFIMAVCFHFMGRRNFPRLKPDFTGSNSGLKKFHFRLAKLWGFVTQLQVEKRIFSLNFFLWITLLGFLPGYTVHRQVFSQEEYLWRYAAGANSEFADEKGGRGIYKELIGHHEKLRRINFSRLTKREEEQLFRYIAPDIKAMEASFSLPKDGSKTHKVVNNPSFKSILLQKLDKTPFLIFFVLILLALFFNLIMRISKRIFLTDFLFSFDKSRLPDKCIERRFNYVNGLDGTKIREWILYHFQLKREEVLFLPAKEDDVNTSDTYPTCKAVVLENIHCLADVTGLVSVLDNFRSTYYPTDKLLFITSGRSLLDIVSETATPEETLLISEWMQRFIFYTVPLHFQQQVLLLPYHGKDWDKMSSAEKKSFEKRIKSSLFSDPAVLEINREVNYGANAAALACLITQELETEPPESFISQDRYEKCILSIQRYNKAYHINIWSKLSMREKKLCYYFASEGFINYTNREVMAALLQKGVLVVSSTEDRLAFFSESFCNHILSNTTPDEHREFRVDEKDHGNAKMIQAASISFVFITVAVIGFYDPNILDRTVAYASAAIGFLGTLYSFFHKGFKSAWTAED